MAGSRRERPELPGSARNCSRKFWGNVRETPGGMSRNNGERPATPNSAREYSGASKHARENSEGATKNVGDGRKMSSRIRGNSGGPGGNDNAATMFSAAAARKVRRKQNSGGNIFGSNCWGEFCVRAHPDITGRAHSRQNEFRAKDKKTTTK